MAAEPVGEQQRKPIARIDAIRAGVSRSATTAIGFVEGRATDSAKVVHQVLIRTRRVGSDVRSVARHVATASRIDSTGGAAGQAAGHAFEILDVRRYNGQICHLVRRTTLRLNSSAHQPGYHAIRRVNGRFAGGIQHKLSASGTRRAIEKLNRVKPNAAANATLRVPRDHFAVAVRAAGSRIRVASSGISSATVRSTVERGSDRLVKLGEAGAPTSRSAVRSARRGAGFAVVVGAVVDARALRNGEIDRRVFVARRVEDFSDAGASAAAASVTAASLAAAGGAPMVVPAAAFAAGVAAGYAARRGVRIVVAQSRQQSRRPRHGRG